LTKYTFETDMKQLGMWNELIFNYSKDFNDLVCLHSNHS
jgi:hypothetical protein